MEIYKNNLYQDMIKKLTEKKEWSKLLDYLDNISCDKENDLTILTQYYKSYNALNRHAKAEIYIDKALSITKENPTLWRDKGNSYLRRNDYKNALSCFIKASSLSPKIASYYVSIANTYILLEDIENAIDNYRKALEIDPKQLSWLKSLDRLLIKRNKLKKDLETKIYQDTIKHLTEEKEWEKLINYLDETSKSKEDDLNTLVQYYKAYDALKKYDKSEMYIDRALLKTKENSTLWRDKGNNYLRRDDYTNALSCFIKASNIRPEIASYHISMANAYILLEDIESAIESYKKALVINPKQISWLKSLANLLIKSDRIQEAFCIYAEIADLEDDFQTNAIYQELQHQIQGGKREASSEYYDNIFSNSEKYLKTAEESIYTDIWLYIVSIIDTYKYNNIIDLGCGPGQFAEFLQVRLPSIKYIGIDFSKSALEIAKQRCPDYQFLHGKLPLKTISSLGLYDIVICTEVLEHIELDIEILKSIESGKPVIASVPNFDSFGHVRYFNTIEEVKIRYAFLFNNLKIVPFSLSSKNIIWVMFGTKV